MLFEASAFCRSLCRIPIAPLPNVYARCDRSLGSSALPFILVLLQAASQRRKVGYESCVYVTEAMPTLLNRMRVREPLPQGRLQIAGSSLPWSLGFSLPYLDLGTMHSCDSSIPQAYLSFSHRTRITDSGISKIGDHFAVYETSLRYTRFSSGDVCAYPNPQPLRQGIFTTTVSSRRLHHRHLLTSHALIHSMLSSAS